MTRLLIGEWAIGRAGRAVRTICAAWAFAAALGCENTRAWQFDSSRLVAQFARVCLLVIKEQKKQAET